MHYNKLKKVLGEEREMKKVVFTDGTFDILHMGHIYLFEKSKEYGDLLVVNVTNDRRDSIYKREPIKPQRNRVKLVSCFENVDYASVHPAYIKNPSLELAKIIKPDVIVQEKGIMSRREIDFWIEYLGYDFEFREVKRRGYHSSTFYINKVINNPQHKLRKFKKNCK